MSKQPNNDPKNLENKIEDLARDAEELTPEQAEEVQGGFSWGATQLGVRTDGTSSHGTGAGAGKVSMQDFHFVM